MGRRPAPPQRLLSGTPLAAPVGLSWKVRSEKSPAVGLGSPLPRGRAVGLGDSLRRKREEQRRLHEQGLASTRYLGWRQAHQQLTRLVEESRAFREGTPLSASASAVDLKEGERVALVANASLVESDRRPGYPVGVLRGFSAEVAQQVKDRANAGSGPRGGGYNTYIAPEEAPKPIDRGTITITSQRVVFQGARQQREWSLGELSGVEHADQLPWTVLGGESHSASPGFLYDVDSTALVRFRLALALAHFKGEVAELDSHLEGGVTAHEGVRPEGFPGSPG